MPTMAHHRRHPSIPPPAPDPAAQRALERARGAVERCELLDARAMVVEAERRRRNSSNGFVDLILEAFAR